MKLMQIMSEINPQMIKAMYKSSIKELIKTRIKNQDLIIKSILSQYSERQILQAIEDIYIYNDYLCIPENTRNSKILRLLEFGGEGIASLGLLREAAKPFRLD